MEKVLYQLPNGIDKFEAFKLIVSSCTAFDVLSDKKDFLNKVIAREHIQTTGMGHGVAIAHGKVSGIVEPIVALGYSDDGICYDNIFPEKVHLLFVIASDVEAQNEYIKAVSSILSWVHDPEFRYNLLAHAQSARCKRFISMLSTRSYCPFQEE